MIEQIFFMQSLLRKMYLFGLFRHMSEHIDLVQYIEILLNFWAGETMHVAYLKLIFLKDMIA